MKQLQKQRNPIAQTQIATRINFRALGFSVQGSLQITRQVKH
jgi:hypothetical protein